MERFLNKDNVTYEINGISKELMSEWKEKVLKELNNNNECIYINQETIDTLNELVSLSNISNAALPEIETMLSNYMMEMGKDKKDDEK